MLVRGGWAAECRSIFQYAALFACQMPLMFAGSLAAIFSEETSGPQLSSTIEAR